MKDIEQLASIVINEAMAIHIHVGPGMLESVYEGLLAQRLRHGGLKINRQMPVRVQIEGLEFPDAFRTDLLVEDKRLIEVKSVERLMPVHAKQTLTYLRLMKLPLGLLINFGDITLKEGLKRVANNYRQGID